MIEALKLQRGEDPRALARKVLKEYSPPEDANWFGQNWLRNWNPGNAPV